ncbi:helix-turn-helix domain-containing protein [Paenibacillus agaridevorans]|uniref:helix-turn-helix domain-containing protein n=1 Tax=Paenibacillus agaridevorans TaxID=171404 RepID=UPI003CCEF5E5
MGSGQLHSGFSYSREGCEYIAIVFHLNFLHSRVLQYIEEHYSREIYIDELASLLSHSRSHFCRVFKDFTGVTPMDYLNFYRVNKAADLLQTDGCKVIDAALQTGFDNLSHFTNTFKKYMQCTPSEYKRDGQHQIIHSTRASAHPRHAPARTGR